MPADDAMFHARGPYRSATLAAPRARPRRRLPLLGLLAVVAGAGAARRALTPPREPPRPAPAARLVRRDDGPLRPIEGVVALVEMHTPDGPALLARGRDGSLRRLTLDADASPAPDRVAQRALAGPFECSPGGASTCFLRMAPALPRPDQVAVTPLAGGRVHLTCGDAHDEAPWTLEGAGFTASDRVFCLRTDDGRAACASMWDTSWEEERQWVAGCESLALLRTAFAVEGVAVGGGAACAWTAAGALHCADLYYAGSSEPSFRHVGSLAGVDRVWIGEARGSLCARDRRGRVWCRGAWGPAVEDPPEDEARRPTLDAFAAEAPLREVPELAGAEALVWAEGQSACALLPRGRVACWGWNHRGQVADGSAYRRVTPARVAAAPGAVSLSAGRNHACAALRDGRVVCWGDNDRGQLGDGTRVPRGAPREVALPAAAVEVAAGAEHTCARTATAGVWCWGAGAHGQLGDGGGRDARAPVRVAGLDGATELSAGAEHTCARAAGVVSCWGRFGCGWPGRSGVRGALRPLGVALAGHAVAVRSFGDFACAELAAGGVRCWGMQNVAAWPEAATGRCAEGVTFAPRLATLAGLPSSSASIDLRREAAPEVPTAVVADAVAAAEGDCFACALTRRGEVWCQGDNDRGQLGDGRAPFVTTPRLVMEAIDPTAAGRPDFPAEASVLTPR